VNERKVLTPSQDVSPVLLRVMLATANVGVVSMLIVWYLLYLKYGEPYEKSFLLVPAELFSGRAGCVATGIEQGFSKYFLLFQICLQDFLYMLYTYVFFIRGYHSLERIPVLGSTLKNVHELALQHKDRITPYGAVGLLAFVLFPFWSTGPLVGVIMGYLIGLRTWITFTAVLSGNFIAVTAWIWFYDRLHNFDPRLAWGLLGVIVAFAVAGFVLGQVRRRKKAAQPAGETAETHRVDTGAATTPPPESDMVEKMVSPLETEASPEEQSEPGADEQASSDEHP
jgi:uncharacterized membrane protein